MKLLQPIEQGKRKTDCTEKESRQQVHSPRFRLRSFLWGNLFSIQPFNTVGNRVTRIPVNSTRKPRIEGIVLRRALVLVLFEAVEFTLGVDRIVEEDLTITAQPVTESVHEGVENTNDGANSTRDFLCDFQNTLYEF